MSRSTNSMRRLYSYFFQGWIVCHFLLPVIGVTSWAGEFTTEVQVTKQLGRDDDFERQGAILLANRQAWGASGKDGRILYRVLKGNPPADLFVAAFDVDKNRLCRYDMILEVFYRDDYRAGQVSEDRVTGRAAMATRRVVAESRIDFAYEGEYTEAGYLGAEGDGRWKLGRIFFERTHRQIIRGIDGSFQFRLRILAPDSAGALISYIRLRAVGREEFLRLREQERRQRGLQRVEYQAKKSREPAQAKAGECDFLAYPVNYLQLVFPNSPAEYGRLDSGLECFEVAGEAEPVSFVLHALKDMGRVSVSVSDLQSEDQKISSDNINIRRVEYNDQRWGWCWEKRYGTCPDYLSFADPIVDIKANTNCQFWQTINVPGNAKSGRYKGTVTVLADGNKVHDIPLSVEVLPIKLVKNDVKHMVYHSPYYRTYDREPVLILRDMRKHGLTPIFYPVAKVERARGRFKINMDDFERQLQEFRREFPEVKTVFVGLSDYYNVYDHMKGPGPRFQRPFPELEHTYKDILLDYDRLGEQYGLEFLFSFQDEPFGFADRRRAAYFCSRIAKSCGLKTWSTHWVQWDKQLPLSQTEINYSVNNLRPLKEVLDVLADAAVRINKNAVEEMRKSKCMLSYYTTDVGTGVRPVFNRFLHGWYPFVINTKYVLSYAYRDAEGDPYDDLGCKAQLTNQIGQQDYLLTYPTWKGDILPTLSYEALREGVEDSHLISMMRGLAEKASDSSSRKARDLGKSAAEFLNKVIGRISTDFYHNYYSKHKDLPTDPMETSILSDLQLSGTEGYEAFDMLRRRVCEYIMQLQDALAEVR